MMKYLYMNKVFALIKNLEFQNLLACSQKLILTKYIFKILFGVLQWQKTADLQN